ncbi:MAG: SpoIIE family protein phosphatase [Bacteroidales bacterium]|nr:SpoIIE family protein phosphatase [Bacteroidales bacterium]
MSCRFLLKNAILILLISFTSLPSLSQAYQFKNYSVNEGLPGRFIYTINQDQNGFIFLGTDKGLCYFDGFDYHMSYISDTLETLFPVSSYETAGGPIYYGFNDGSVYYTVDRKLEKVPGISAVRVNDIIESADSMILIITQGRGIFLFDPANPVSTLALDNPAGEFLFCAALTDDGRILLGTQNGLVLCSYENKELETIAEARELEYIKVQDIQHSGLKDTYFIGTEDEGVFTATLDGNNISIERPGEGDLFSRSRIQSLMIDDDRALWISTFGNGLIKAITDSIRAEVISYELFDGNSGLVSNDIKTSYEDSWGNIWIGHFGSGVSVLSSDAYKFYRPGGPGMDNNIIFVGEYRGNVLAGTASGYYLFDPDTEEILGYTDLSRSINMARISDYCICEDGSFLLGTEEQGLYRRNSRGTFDLMFRSDNNMENHITDILSDGSYIWLGTRGGLISININTGNIKRFTTSEKLPHNNINQLISDGKGNIIVATESNRLYFINHEQGVTTGKAIIYGGIRNVFQSFDIDTRGKIWGATRGSGLFCFENDSVWSINERSGLYSDFCYSLLCDSKNNLWVGHQRGFTFYNQGLNLIRTFDDIFSTGADCNENAICETSDAYVLIGTTEGFMVYNPAKDKSKLNPPRTAILSVKINDELMPLKDVYNLPYSLHYKIEVEFVGLNYAAPEKVYYSYSMENFDTEWSDPTYMRSVTYRLNDGTYRFNILAYSFDGLSDNQVKSFVINIKKPFWSTWWFISGSVVLLVLLVIIIIKIRERAQLKAKRMLEEELAERTKEVIIQKEEIEYQNREITDSINYAQRIQASLLPPVERLSENFRGSFVFYRPRDIVSGDFYWFDTVSEDKIMIVCADSTGHGVPGAFMSMIGSALLQEIVNRKEITRPSQILRALDQEITTTLNQTGDDTSNDGMDMVVCEYNPKTRLLRFASALRPVILVMDGEQYYIRGNKNSVGGEYMEEKYFDDQEYYLRENDVVYIFSDGYPDQFGGPDGKKLKIVRLKRLIENIKDLSMDEQMERVSKYFDDWMADHAQVDDVLLMGFKV